MKTVASTQSRQQASGKTTVYNRGENLPKKPGRTTRTAKKAAQGLLLNGDLPTHPVDEEKTISDAISINADSAAIGGQEKINSKMCTIFGNPYY